MSTKLHIITQRAEEDRSLKFTSLAHLLDEEFLKESFRELKRDKAPGIDGITVKEYEKNLEENIKDLVSRLKGKRYKAQPVRRTYIPKANGEKRPLGIPTVEDKIVQMGIKKILEAIYEVDFEEISYGFRPNCSCHDAIDKMDRCIMDKPINYVVDMDIEKFFDTIEHKWLMKCLQQRIRDTRLLRIIGRFLRAGIMEEGKITKAEKGTPQGGVLSPLLANIYLHYILDRWFERKVKGEIKGYAQLIRYADDFIVLFENEEEARIFVEKLKERLSKFGLKIAEDKSRIIEFGKRVWQRAQKERKEVETFDFLGFTHYCDKTKRGKFKLGRKTSERKFRQKVKMMNQWLKEVRNAMEIKEIWKIIEAKLIGHYRYYGISGNSRSINKFYDIARKLIYKWINRRSQKKCYDWEEFTKFMKYNPLPKPKIYHLYPSYS